MKKFKNYLEEKMDEEKAIWEYPDTWIRMLDDAASNVEDIITQLDYQDTTKLSAISKEFKNGLKDLKTARKKLTKAQQDLKRYGR
jgi:uncharacterized membrane protein YjjP (DUF1212 family)